MYADELLKPWLAPLRQALDGIELFDCHTHVGTNDPSGFSVTEEELVESLGLAQARAAVFPLREPSGYAEANLRAVDLAARHEDRLVAFCRLDPRDVPAERAEEALAAGARGIKLHPAGEEFDIADPRLEPVFRLAHERRLPVMIHAGPELDGVGETALALCERFRGARLILAHNALTDLSWIHEHVDDHPNLFFDTSWWGPVHTLALLELIPPGHILSASDLPYCSPLSGAFTTLRCAFEVGLSEPAIRSVMGEQFARLLEGEAPADLGPAPGVPQRPLDPTLERVHVTLLTGLEALQRGGDMANAMPVTRHACKVPDHDPHAPVLRAVQTLLDLYEEHAPSLETGNQYAPGWDLISAAALVARTPQAPLPETA